jgi:hypothetical protein
MLGLGALVALASCSNGNASPAPSASMAAPPIIPTATPIRASDPRVAEPARDEPGPDQGDDLEMPVDLVERRESIGGSPSPAAPARAVVRAPILSDQLLLDDGVAPPPPAQPVAAARPAPEPAATPASDEISEDDRALIEAASQGPSPTEMIARREPTVATRPSAPARRPAVAAPRAPAKPARPPAPGTTVTFGPTTSMSVSSLSPTDVRKAIQRSFLPGIRACHAQALAADPALSGTVTVQINVGPDGQIAVARAFGFSTAVDACIKAAARGWRFEIPRDAAGQPTTAPFKIELRLAPA